MVGVACRIFASCLIICTLDLVPVAADGMHGTGGIVLLKQGSVRKSIESVGALSRAQVARLSDGNTSRVIVLMRRQFLREPGLDRRRASQTVHVRYQQRSVLLALRLFHAQGVRPFDLIDGVAATLTVGEAEYIRSQPGVRAVVPDAVLHQRPMSSPPAPHVSGSPGNARTLKRRVAPSCGTSPALEPEALGLTSAAFVDPRTPQAQSLATGRGVSVAFLADGIDPANPDFNRPDGSHVFSLYKDFSGDGAEAPTSGAEAFGDASSIAAQGIQTYDINDFLLPAQRVEHPCQIRIRGIAPGASLIGLKVFNRYGAGFTSGILEALQYAVNHGAAVIDESFVESPFPDLSQDPVSLANKAAAGYGVTVVAATGDAGTAGTLATPATDPWVIGAGASTSLGVYEQISANGAQLGSGGFKSDNISSSSSAGISQTAQKTVDVVAPGDAGWAVCSPNSSVYRGCITTYGAPTPFQTFGDSSASASFVAGEAALVIQAFRDAHAGQIPSPSQVKEIIMSTASDLGEPSDEQGAGLINCLKAVRAAISFPGSKTRTGSTLLMRPSLLSATAAPNARQKFVVQFTNDGVKPQVVRPTVRMLAPPFARASFKDALNPVKDLAFVDQYGVSRSYTTRVLVVPAGADRLDASIAWDSQVNPSSSVSMTLFDPAGRLTAYSAPQGPSGYGHLDVRRPAAGAWKAVIWTARTNGYRGTVHLEVSESRFVSGGSVLPAEQTLPPGKTGQFTIATRAGMPAGDTNGEVAK